MHRRRVGVLIVKELPRGVDSLSGESLTHKCSRTESSEASNSSFYKFQETKFDSSTNRQHGSSILLIKHGRNPKQTFKRNLKRNLGLSHREENTFDSRIYTYSEQSSSRLGIPKLPGQQWMETLPNCFQTNLQSFSETVIGPVCFQTLPPTATINNLAIRPSKCSNISISAGMEITRLAEPVIVSNPVKNV